jgi:hypothetical protein
VRMTPFVGGKQQKCLASSGLRESPSELVCAIQVLAWRWGGRNRERGRAWGQRTLPFE